MGEGDFRPPPTAPRPHPSTDVHETWNITTSWTRPRVQNFRGLCRRGWSGQIASLTHQSFCPFFFSSSRPHVASLDTSPRTIRHYTSFPPRKCLLGVRKMIFEIWPPLPSKNVKIGTVSWRSMEKCIRPISGTVIKSDPVQTWYRDWPTKWHHATWLQGQNVKGQGHNVT